MRTSINLAAMLTVAGGLAAATLPSAARANCSPAASTSGHSPSSGSSVGGFGQQGDQFDPAAEYEKGLKAFTLGDFRRAKTAFTLLLPYAEGQAPIFYLAGASRMGLGDHKGAVKLLEKAVKLDPSMLIAQQDLAIAYARTGDLPRAQAMLATIEAKAAQCGAGCDAAEPIQVAIDAVKEAMAA